MWLLWILLVFGWFLGYFYELFFGETRRGKKKSVLTSKLSENATKTCNSGRDNDPCEYNGVVRSMSLPQGK